MKLEYLEILFILLIFKSRVKSSLHKTFKYKVVVVASPKNVSVQFGITPSPPAVPWLCSGCFKFGLRRQVFRQSSKFSVSAFYALLMLCLSFLVFQNKYPHCILKQDRDLHPSQHFVLNSLRTFLQPPPAHQVPSELGSSKHILSSVFSEV